MERVGRIVPREVVRQDVEAIAVIYRNLGAPVAEQLVTRALGELALAMTAIADKVQGKDLKDLDRQLQRLRRMARDIGLVSLAAVAEDAGNCLDRGDTTAFAAVWARLMRVARTSLSQGPGVADLSS